MTDNRDVAVEIGCDSEHRIPEATQANGPDEVAGKDPRSPLGWAILAEARPVSQLQKDVEDKSWIFETKRAVCKTTSL